MSSEYLNYNLYLGSAHILVIFYQTKIDKTDEEDRIFNNIKKFSKIATLLRNFKAYLSEYDKHIPKVTFMEQVLQNGLIVLCEIIFITVIIML